MILTLLVGVLTFCMQIVERLLFDKIYIIINYLNDQLTIFRNSLVVQRLCRLFIIMDNNDNNSTDVLDDVPTSLYMVKIDEKMLFEFKRVRCRNLKTDNKVLKPDVNMNYEVPSKRSGHRAVCDDENLWIWGGYCPVESNNENDSPMLPEVC